MVFRVITVSKSILAKRKRNTLEEETIGRDTYLFLNIKTIRGESFIATNLVSSQSTSDLNREGK